MAQPKAPYQQRLDELTFTRCVNGLGEVRKGLNTLGQPLRLNGVTYAHGLGVHAQFSVNIDLQGAALRFVATVGVDDLQAPHPKLSRPVEFIVSADGIELWRSGRVVAGEEPRQIAVDLTGKDYLRLETRSLAHDTLGTIANWCDAALLLRGDRAPFVFGDTGDTHGSEPDGITKVTETDLPVLEYPDRPASPHIGGPEIFGCRPGKLFSYVVPVRGAGPFRFSAAGLPDGLSIDATTGRISGRLAVRGDHRVTLVVETADAARVEKPLTLRCGSAICLTPPMGWASWNAFGPDIDDRRIRETAKALVDTGLAAAGYSYVNIDDGWQGERTGPERALQGNARFPDMPALCAYIHSLGLKPGIYSTPWATSYMGLSGGSADTPDGAVFENRRSFGVYPFHREDAALFASWGVDYLKYDWAGPDFAHAKAMHDALLAQDRDIVYSLSGEVAFSQGRRWMEIANLWRTTPDIEDRWDSIYSRAFTHYRWRSYQRPGCFNDPDMLVLGHLSWGKTMRPCRITRDEQATHFCFWVINAAPLLLGCDVQKLDAFTLSLLLNEELIAINQDALALQARRIRADQGLHVYAKALENGDLAIGLFNTRGTTHAIPVLTSELGIEDGYAIRDCLHRADLDQFSERLELSVRPHGCRILRLKKPAKPASRRGDSWPSNNSRALNGA